MYEIWLVLNILWEMAVGSAAAVLGALALWVVLMVAALRRRGARWGAGLPLALLAGVVVAALAFVVVPAAVGSSFGDMGYWVDWANLAAIAAGFGAVAVAFAWPLMAMRAGGRTA
jgi:hypothetical protein